MIRRITILAFVCLVSVSVTAPTPAQAGLVEFFFPSLRKKEPDPGETLQAPFAAPPQTEQAAPQPAPAAGNVLPENAIPLDQPHRDASSVGEWLVTAISESMTFSDADYNKDLAKTENHFNAHGRKEYLAFLNEKSIMKVLESNKFFIRGFVEEAPFLLTSAPVDGTYHWLFEVPIMLSYMDRTMTDYKKAQPVSQKVLLTVQIGRSANAKNTGGIVIERWSGKVQSLDKE